MDDRYWPARVGYLRRGTPVRVVVGAETEDTVVTDIGVDEVGQYVYCAGVAGCVGYDRLYLDLSDVTARAHAVMAWTKVHPPYEIAKSWSRHEGETDICDRLHDAIVAGLEADRAAFDSTGWSEHEEVLCRMRSMDDTVTIAEARAALAWAESVGAP